MVVFFTFVAVVESVGVSQGVGGVRQTAAGGCAVCSHPAVSIINTVHADSQPTGFGTLRHCCRNKARSYQAT